MICSPCLNKWHKRYYICYCTEDEKVIEAAGEVSEEAEDSAKDEVNLEDLC